MLGSRCFEGFSPLTVSGGHFLFSGFSCCKERALEHSLRSCGTRAWLLQGTWDLPGSGIEPVSPALAGGFFTTEPPRNPSSVILNIQRNFKEREGWGSCRDRRTLKERVDNFNYQRYLNPWSYQYMVKAVRALEAFLGLSNKMDTQW